MKILITGTAGFIGYHLAKKLLERGDAVVGIDNINDYYNVELKFARLAETGISNEAIEWGKVVQSSEFPRYSFIRMNIEDRKEMSGLFEREKFDKVCNLAAQAGVRYSLENPYAYIQSNIEGFLNVLEACRINSIKHLVYASSSSVYGSNTKMPLSTDDKTDHPVSLYAATKKSNELMAHAYSYLYKLPATGLRFFTVYGPWGRPDMAYFLFTRAILEGKPIRIYNFGNMIRDFTYVDNIIEGVIRVIDHPPLTPVMLCGTPSQVPYSPLQTTPTRDPLISRTVPYKIYNIGNSSPVALTEFIDVIERKLNRKAIREYLPMQPGDMPYTEADVTGLAEDLGYRPDTPVEQGISHFIEWYKAYYKITDD